MEPSFPLLPLAALTITAVAFCLIIYYTFLTKCFWQQHLHILVGPFINILRSSRQEEDTDDEDPFIAFSPTASWNNNIKRGLDDSVIQKIPTFRFRHENEAKDCVVCVNEFQEHDMLRVLPTCGHAFHLECIDVWLQSNANCPLCRTSILGKSPNPMVDSIVAPSSSPQESFRVVDSSSEEDFVVIEFGSGDEVEVVRETERQREAELRQQKRNRSPDKFEEKIGNSKARKHYKFSVMGDECIDVREKKKDDEFSIQPLRRSFSLDSAADQQLYSAVQAIIHQTSEHERRVAESARDQKLFFLPFQTRPPI